LAADLGAGRRSDLDGAELMTVQAFMIESEAEADDYLRDLLAKPEYRSMSEVELRAHKYINDDGLAKYFTDKAREILSSEG
jgi:hypothetical protein